MSPVDFETATIAGGAQLSRRRFLAVGGALVVYASLAPRDAFAQAAASTTLLDPTRSVSWIEIRSDNTVQFRTGKCDFGQSSIYIAYPQIIAEELGVPWRRLPASSRVIRIAHQMVAAPSACSAPTS